MNKIPSELMSDFMIFSKVYIEIDDADPMYPVIKSICDKLGMDLEQRIEFCFWYMCWYNLRSALESWLENAPKSGMGRFPTITAQQALKPIKLERRGLRGGTNIIKHWDNQLLHVRQAGGWIRWAEQRFTQYPKINWSIASDTITRVWNNGRWAAYKGSELLEKVCGLKLQAPDMGHADSSNPRKALSLLFSGMPHKDDNSKAAIKTLDDASEDLMGQCMQADIPLDNDMALLETCCCGFYSLHRGDYYLGCDIDLMLEVAMQKDDEVRKLILDARKDVFPQEYLGEIHGWSEHDKPRLKLYRDTGDIVVR